MADGQPPGADERQLRGPDGPLQVALRHAPSGLPLSEVAPAAAARGAVVVVQEAFGVTRHIEDVARRFAAAGYHAVAPHLFHRGGDQVLGADADMDSVRAAMGQLDRSGITADLDATLAHLAEAGLPAARVGVVGFCMGGSVALAAGTLHALGAAVSFYGGGVTSGRFGFAPLVELAPALRTPWLGLYGDEDASIPVAEVQALQEAAARAPVPTEVVRYPGAGHAFHNDERPMYVEAAARDAWRRTLDWLATHLPTG